MPPWASRAARNFRSGSQSSSGASGVPPSFDQGAAAAGHGVAGDHDRHDGGALAGIDQAGELAGVKIGEIVDRDQGHGRAGERPDELAQLAVEPRQREVGNAITGTKAERVGHRVRARQWWAL